ncbi:hypothetical protein SDC9_74930 [bioreactor metagenome]|uniref:Uncharacterized protein n=1 Tax=bioreactor metagenome TaxID=1076179 RepID=A0A644YK95_9ZZZZ
MKLLQRAFSCLLYLFPIAGQLTLLQQSSLGVKLLVIHGLHPKGTGLEGAHIVSPGLKQRALCILDLVAPLDQLVSKVLRHNAGPPQPGELLLIPGQTHTVLIILRELFRQYVLFFRLPLV